MCGGAGLVPGIFFAARRVFRAWKRLRLLMTGGTTIVGEYQGTVSKEEMGHGFKGSSMVAFNPSIPPSRQVHFRRDRRPWAEIRGRLVHWLLFFDFGIINLLSTYGAIISCQHKLSFFHGIPERRLVHCSPVHKTVNIAFAYETIILAILPNDDRYRTSVKYTHQVSFLCVRWS